MRFFLKIFLVECFTKSFSYISSKKKTEELKSKMVHIISDESENARIIY